LDSTASIPDVGLTPTLLVRAGGDGASLYGCDIRDAHEVIPLRPMTRLPGAPACVRGLINLRGTIVTVLDLGVRLDATRPVTADGSILLVRIGEHVAGLVVGEVVDVRSIAVDETTPSANEGITRGIATVDGAAVIVLDLDALLTQVLRF